MAFSWGSDSARILSGLDIRPNWKEYDRHNGRPFRKLVNSKPIFESQNRTNSLFCSDLDYVIRLGSRISPHRHQVVVEVHWRGAQRWRFISWVVATFNHVGGSFNSLRPRQNRRHLADEIFKCIFWNENVWISITVSLKFVPKGPINNIPALVQIMAWRRPGDKPLSGPMMVRLPTHICVTRPQWVNLSMAATGDVLIMPSFRIWGYVLHVEHISCVIMNCGQLQWTIPSLFSIAL